MLLLCLTRIIQCMVKPCEDLQGFCKVSLIGIVLGGVLDRLGGGVLFPEAEHEPTACFLSEQQGGRADFFIFLVFFSCYFYTSVRKLFYLKSPKSITFFLYIRNRYPGTRSRCGVFFFFKPASRSPRTIICFLDRAKRFKTQEI